MLAAVKAWRIRFRTMELQRLASDILGKKTEAKCYRLAKDCYRVLAKYDEAKKEG